MRGLQYKFEVYFLYFKGIVLSWNMTLGKSHSEITNYQLFAYQETSAAPSTNLWKKVTLKNVSNVVNLSRIPHVCKVTRLRFFLVFKTLIYSNTLRLNFVGGRCEGLTSANGLYPNSISRRQ